MPHFHRCWVCEEEEAIYCESSAPEEYCTHHDADDMIPAPVCPGCETRVKSPSYAKETQEAI